MKGLVFTFKKRNRDYGNVVWENKEFKPATPEKTMEAKDTYFDKYKPKEYVRQERERSLGKEIQTVYVDGVSKGSRTKQKNGRVNLREIDVKEYSRKYGLLFCLALTVLAGIIWGSLVAKDADQNLALSLDFLFTTNLQARVVQSWFETFCACFTSNFVFLAVVFLLGLTPWGVPAIPVVTAFKGFGIGLCAGYLYSTYGLKGIGFYMLVLLIGLFVFTVAMLILGQNAFRLSGKLFQLIFMGKTKDFNIKETIKGYMLKGGYMLIAATAASVIDTLLWCAFTPLFNF